MAKLAGILASDNATEISEIAHSLKGSSLNISAQTLGGCFKVIEDQGRDNNLEKINENYELAFAEYQQVKAQLLTLLN